MYFDWDDKKNASNLRKHGVSFENAARVFDDPLFLAVFDREVAGEERLHAVGIVDGIVLLVVHTVLGEDPDDGEAIVRIISAREAEPHERKRYEEDI